MRTKESGQFPGRHRHHQHHHRPGRKRPPFLLLDVNALMTRLTARIAAAKSRLLAGGVLQTVEWGIPTGERDNRGRTAYEYSEIYAMIEDRPALDRGSSATDRADATILTILDPVAILDEDLFRWGDPPHTHRVKAIDGLLQDEETGVRFASEVEIVR